MRHTQLPRHHWLGWSHCRKEMTQTLSMEGLPLHARLCITSKTPYECQTTDELALPLLCIQHTSLCGLWCNPQGTAQQVFVHLPL